MDEESVLIEFPLGLVFGLLELYLFPLAERWSKNWAFSKVFLIKTILYTAVIYFVSVALFIADG